MQRTVLSIIISLIAVTLVVVHIIYPDLRIDTITLGLLGVAIIPWMYSVFKVLELPGGLKVEYRDLEKVKKKAAAAGLLAPPEVTERPDYLSLVTQDPNLALAGLRIDLERELKKLADRKKINVEWQSVNKGIQQLTNKGVITKESESALSDLFRLLNRAVHGAEVDPSSVEWAMETGPRLLTAIREHGRQKDETRGGI